MRTWGVAGARRSPRPTSGATGARTRCPGSARTSRCSRSRHSWCSPSTAPPPRSAGSTPPAGCLSSSSGSGRRRTGRRATSTAAPGGHGPGPGGTAARHPAAVVARRTHPADPDRGRARLRRGSVVHGAADMSFVPRLVPRQHLQPAHARIDGADAVSSMAGPALGGVLVSAVGAPLAVLVDAATYVYSAVTVRRIDVEEPASRTGVTVRGLLRDVGEGVRWAYGGSGLRPARARHSRLVRRQCRGRRGPGAVRAAHARSQRFQFGLVGAAGGSGAVLGTAVTTPVGQAARGPVGRSSALMRSPASAWSRWFSLAARVDRWRRSRGTRPGPGSLRPGHGDQQLARDELPPARDAR